jgi:DNA-directed RNA polymerase subunit M/transcription elongation factor TFIIS
MTRIILREGVPQMEQQTPPSRKCPVCGSANYTFRSRKQIEATSEQEAMLETKYRCRTCEHEWKEKVPGVLQERQAPQK